MNHIETAHRYTDQNKGRPLTPKQKKRLKLKINKEEGKK